MQSELDVHRICSLRLCVFYGAISNSTYGIRVCVCVCVLCVCVCVRVLCVCVCVCVCVICTHNVYMMGRS